MKVTSAEESPQRSVERKTAISYATSPDETISQLPGLERRTYSRLNSKVHLCYKAFKSKEDLVKRGFKPEQLSITVDISGGGLLFLSDESLPIGSTLELKIELPDEEPIECLARIVRIEEEKKGQYRIGVCFLDLSSAERARLNRYVVQGEVYF
jgi:c-di-GMP-binding flagellar brake protein YcgR